MNKLSLKNKINSASFIFEGSNSIVAALTNPHYFVRKNLYRNIKLLAGELNGDLLDFGCGAKPYKVLFSKCNSYVGLDIQTSGHSHENEFVDVFYDGKTIPFEDGTFDSVFSSEVFEHVFNIDEVLDELERVLKPNGQMLITCPFVWYEHEIPYDFGRYCSYGLSDLLNRHGFEIVKIEKSCSYIETVYQLKIEYRIRAFTSRVRNPIIRFFLQIVLITPLIIRGLILNCILPKDYGLYGDNVVLCKKR